MTSLWHGIFGVVVWTLVATAAMTVLLESSQRLGWSRLSLPFLFGTFVTEDRGRAYAYGFGLYLVGAWAFAFLYYAVFSLLGRATWWLGGLLGLLHGLVVIAVMLPVMSYLHPRIANEYDGPTATRRIEPPGFLGLNYGIMTPLVTLAGQLLYGVILGSFLQPH